jgi:hypothetical protein
MSEVAQPGEYEYVAKMTLVNAVVLGRGLHPSGRSLERDDLPWPLHAEGSGSHPSAAG